MKLHFIVSLTWLSPKAILPRSHQSLVSLAFNLPDNGMLSCNNGKGMKKLLRPSLTNQVCVCFIEIYNS